jgi:exonuclease III
MKLLSWNTGRPCESPEGNSSCVGTNTAQKEIDLARPRENANVSGFLQIKRDWMDKLVGLGYVDVFRIYNPLPNQYTWWDMMTRARERIQAGGLTTFL